MSNGAAMLDFVASDVSQQKVRNVEGVSPDTTAAELVQNLIDDLNLSRNDAEGRSLTYRAMLRREARHLHGTERVGDAVENGDWLVLQPNVDAG